MKNHRQNKKNDSGKTPLPNEASYIEALGKDSLLRLRVQPRASKTRVVGMLDDRLKIALAAPPVNGKANQELISFLAKKLSLAKMAITVVKGQNSRMKSVRIHGLDADSVLKLL